MAVDQTPLKIDPYTSTVPTVQLPPDVISGETRPSGPLAGQFGGHKGSGPLAIADALFKGVMLGHKEKADRKARQAEATVAAADSASQAAYQQYQDALSKAGGDVKNAEAQAAYQAYLGVFNKGKEAKAQFVIPEKGQKTDKGKKGEKSKVPGMGGIKEFFEANPHIIPSMALMAMQPKPQGLSREAQIQNLELKGLQQNIDIGQQTLESNKEIMQRQREQNQRQDAERQVEEKGGVDAVIADKNASPDLQMAARRMKYEVLDKQSPEGKLKMDLTNKVLSGQTLTPQEHMVAGSMGIVPLPVADTVTAKNGHQQRILVDPTTNQQVGKALDLGPPQWAQEFYAKRAADKNDLKKAVEADPAAYGITVGPDAKANKAAIDARVEQMYVRSEFGIQTLADQFGRTGYEVQRDNEQLTGLMKEFGLDGHSKKSWLDDTPPTLTYPDGKTTTVGSTYMSAMLHEFITKPSENAGVMAYRDTPENPDGKSPETLDAERKFLYQFVKNHLMTQKGKQAMTSDQADAFLKRTALGQPISARQGISPPPQPPAKQAGITPPPQPGRGFFMSGGIPVFGRPPQPGETPQQQQPTAKLYMVPGYESPVQLSEEEAAKAKAANIPIEELSPEIMNQFLGK